MSQLRSALGAAPSQDLPSVPSAHPLHKAMLFAALAFFWLIRAKHDPSTSDQNLLLLTPAAVCGSKPQPLPIAQLVL